MANATSSPEKQRQISELAESPNLSRFWHTSYGHLLALVAFAPVDWMRPLMPRGVTEANLRHAKAIVGEVLYALSSGNAEWLERLEPAYAALRATPSSESAEQARRAALCSTLERHAVAFHGLSERARPTQAANLRDIIAIDYDPAFATLTQERIAEALAEIDIESTQHGNRRKGGQKKGKPGEGNKGPARVAAELAVEAEAMGFRQGPDGYDAAVEDATGKIQQAMSRRKKPSRLTPPG